MATLKKQQASNLNFERNLKPHAPRRAARQRPCLPPRSWNFQGVSILALGAFLLAEVLCSGAAETAVPDLPRVAAGAASNRVHRAYVEFSERFAREPTN